MFVKTWIQEGWYPLLSWGSFGGFRGFLVAPGTYTIKLSVDGQEFSQSLLIKKDPHSEGTVEDIKKQIRLQMAIRQDLNTVSDMISQIEWMRRQCYDLRDVLKAGQGEKDLLKAIDDFDKKLCSIENELFQPIIAEGDTKSFRYPQKLYFKLSVLAEDVAKDVDLPPNKQQLEVYDVLNKRLAVQKKRYQKLLAEDLPTFNNFLQEKKLAGIVVPEIK